MITTVKRDPDRSNVRAYQPHPFSDTFGELILSGNGNFTLTDLDLSSANAEIAANGWHFETDRFLSHGLYVVVPEPSRALLLLGELIAITLRRQRQRA